MTKLIIRLSKLLNLSIKLLFELKINNWFNSRLTIIISKLSLRVIFDRKLYREVVLSFMFNRVLDTNFTFLKSKIHSNWHWRINLNCQFWNCQCEIESDHWVFCWQTEFIEMTFYYGFDIIFQNKNHSATNSILSFRQRSSFYFDEEYFPFRSRR